MLENAEKEKVIQLYKDLMKKNNNHFQKILEMATDFSRSKNAIYEKYDIENTNKFCIYEAISDKYYLENFHSDILATLLNPETKEIGTLDSIILFLDFLKVKHGSVKSAEVTREFYTGDIEGRKGYIDILIRYNDDGKDKAIIIENKINFAPDMPNQLARYIKSVEEDEEKPITDYKVVYLTLTKDKSLPNIDCYDKEFDNYKAKLLNNQILKHIVALSENDNCLLKGYLASYISFIDNKLNTSFEDNNNTKSIVNNLFNNKENKKYLKIREVISQYIILLEHLAGDVFMENAKKELIKKIYETQDNFNAMQDLNEVWNIKEKILNSIIVEEILNDNYFRSNEIKISEETKFGSDVILLDNGNEKYYVYMDKSCLDFGFAAKNAFKNKEQKDLIEKLKNANLKDISNIAESTAEWVFCYVNSNVQNVIKDTIDNIKKLLELN